MSHRTRRVVAVLGAAALTIPSAAAAAPGKGKGSAGSDAASKQHSSAKAETRSKGKGKAKAKRVKLATYVVKGVYEGAGIVDVTGGNAHTRRAKLIGDDVEFDFSRAKLVVADTDGDQQVDAGDLVAGDKLVIQLKLPRTLGEGPYVARKVVDRTNPPVEEDEQESEDHSGTGIGSDTDSATGTDTGSDELTSTDPAGDAE